MKTDLSCIKKQLTDASLKVTHQRLVILEALHLTDNHPTAENLFEILKPNNPSLSIGTVYKTLDTLVEHGLIKKVSSTESQMRYDAKLAHHNHLFVENTKEIIDFEDKELTGIINDYLSHKKFTNLKIKDVQIQIKADKIDLNKQVAIN